MVKVIALDTLPVELTYDEAIILSPGTILKCRDGHYAMVVIDSSSAENHSIIVLTPNPTIIDRQKGYKSFFATNLNMISLSKDTSCT